MGSGDKSTESRFSLDDYIARWLELKNAVIVEGAVQEDGDYYVVGIGPAGGPSRLRFRKADIIDITPRPGHGRPGVCRVAVRKGVPAVSEMIVSSDELSVEPGGSPVPALGERASTRRRELASASFRAWSDAKSDMAPPGITLEETPGDPNAPVYAVLNRFDGGPHQRVSLGPVEGHIITSDYIRTSHNPANPPNFNYDYFIAFALGHFAFKCYALISTPISRNGPPLVFQSSQVAYTDLYPLTPPNFAWSDLPGAAGGSQLDKSLRIGGPWSLSPKYIIWNYDSMGYTGSWSYR